MFKLKCSRLNSQTDNLWNAA